MKKAFIKSISILCALLLMLLTLFSCNTSTDEEATAPSNLHTVKFNSNGGTYIPDVEVRDGQKISEPDAPTRENYIFLYWENDNRRWLFSSKSITKDMTLSALWISAADLFTIEPTENPNELLITGFATQKEIYNLSIPEKINGKTIIGFTDNAFERIHESHAQHLTIPATVHTVGAEAFKNIKNVHVKFLGTISTLGISSFEECDTLETLKLGSGLTAIPARCFFEASSLMTIDIPEGVTVIEEDAFSACAALRTIVLPTTLTKIENSAFADSSALAVVFFKGTPEQFDAIDVSGKNDDLLNAKVYYYSESQPAEAGDFWHYDASGAPILWQ